VIAHEYGHHVAAQRSNAPWNAENWGTKRWATAMNVCRRVRSGKLHPGDERVYYLFNPGEAFAEAYRVLNERTLGLPVTPWALVDASLQPTQAALDALRQDVVAPWATAQPRTYAGSFAKTGPQGPRTFLVPTPFDGSLATTLTAPRGAVYRVRIDGKAAASEIVCGVRTTRVQVERVSGYGPFTLSVTAP
jgi:hypothetical protein